MVSQTINSTKTFGLIGRILLLYLNVTYIYIKINNSTGHWSFKIRNKKLLRALGMVPFKSNDSPGRKFVQLIFSLMLTIWFL